MNKYMTKPSGRVPKRVGAIRLKELPYKDGWVIDAFWTDPAHGKSGRGHKRFHNWRHAEAFAEAKNKRLDELKAKGAGRHTVNDAADSFVKRRTQLTNGKDRGLSPDTLRQNRIVIERYIKPKFGHMLLAALTRRDIDDWVIEQKASGCAFHTVDGRLRILRQVIDHAVDREMMRALPPGLDKVKVPGKPTKRADIPDRSDLEALRKYLNEPRPLKNGRLKWSCLRVLVLLGASCGMRAGEVAGLRWDAIDPNNGEIEIKESIARVAGRKGPKTEAGYRKVPTTLRARAILEEHAIMYKQLEGQCVGPVLRSRDTEYLRPEQVSAWFREVMIETGLVKPGTQIPKFSFHALRHWCASHWMKATGGDVHQVAKWMGHKNASMTLDIYGHTLDDPAARDKMLRIPDWLDPVVQIDAPSPVRPIKIAEPPPALPAPEEHFEPDANGIGPIEQDLSIHVPDIAKPWVKPFIAMLAEGTPVREAYNLIAPQMGYTKPQVQEPAIRQHVCREMKRLKLPIPQQLAPCLRDEGIQAVPVPDIAKPWVKPFFMMLAEGTPVLEAYRRIEPQMETEFRHARHVVENDVRAEFARLKLPLPIVLEHRFRDEKILQLHGQKYQMSDIARLAGSSVSVVHRALKSRHKPNANNPLNRKLNSPMAGKGKTPSEHKVQLKLL